MEKMYVMAYETYGNNIHIEQGRRPEDASSYLARQLTTNFPMARFDGDRYETDTLLRWN